MRRSIGGIAAAAALVVLLTQSEASAAQQGTQCMGADTPITSSNIQVAERTLLCEVNVYRVANGVAPLTNDPALGMSARGHSQYMERVNKADSKGIGDGTPTSRASDAGFECGLDCVGENIAYSGLPVTTPTDVFAQWRGSTSHSSNMLKREYVTAGTGFAVGPNFGAIVTQDFAIVSHGATDTASDMLTSAACEMAESAVESAKAKVEKAKARVAKAKDAERKKKARTKLRKAKAGLRDASKASGAACDLTF